MADDLVARTVEDHCLALENRDERVVAIPDAIQHVAGGSSALFAELTERRKLRGGQRRTRRRIEADG